MLFAFPKKRINDTGWFISKTEVVTFGKVILITMAITEHECKVYYRFVDGNNVEYTVAEAQVLESDVVIPSPKYGVGDSVIYSFLTADRKHEQRVDVIKYVEIGIHDKGAIDISYVMEHMEEEWVLEEEILSLSDPIINSSNLFEETKEQGYTEYDCYGHRASDV